MKNLFNLYLSAFKVGFKNIQTLIKIVFFLEPERVMDEMIRGENRKKLKKYEL
jgi:hypothetical protein